MTLTLPGGEISRLPPYKGHLLVADLKCKMPGRLLHLTTTRGLSRILGVEVEIVFGDLELHFRVVAERHPRVGFVVSSTEPRVGWISPMATTHCRRRVVSSTEGQAEADMTFP